MSLNVSAIVIKVIHLNMSFGVPGYIRYLPAALEVRGRDGKLGGRVEIVGDGDDRAYLVRPAGRTEEAKFSVGAHEEAAIYLHSVVRGWRAQ
ncbi:hypothetical protein [Nonomuraea basaltis]|uniref:hypothetical protein n=1 Tax=Nonomuraea basaltis TaxID=2495887 RepID=UPI00110C64AC|nr:hypothetical protein [Nonomuraea basaltis]TMR94458.1 hypothetical protein EJK15_33595 [Nonomuraea basaltis]